MHWPPDVFGEEVNDPEGDSRLTEPEREDVRRQQGIALYMPPCIELQRVMHSR